jgi:hypothetical protein
MGFPKDFLNKLASQKDITEAEKEVFLAMFAEEKSKIQIQNELHISSTAINTRLTGIYKKFEIYSNGPTKAKELKKYLDNEYENWKTENLETLPTPTTPELSLPSHPFSPLSGSIENPLKVFSRKREIRRIFELLNSGSSVALIGEAAIGKSSILQVVRSQAKVQLNPSREPIYINLSDVLNEHDFYLALCDQVGIEEQKGYRLSRELKKHRLLLILDNVEKMAWDGFTNQVRDQIRALATDGGPPLRLVVAARTPLDKLFPDSNMVSPFENICQEEIIKRWDKKTCCEFITDRLKETSVQFSEAEITELTENSKGHPKQLMKLCYELYNSYQ